MLGNERPQILVRLENHILRAVVSILEGNSPENVMNALHAQMAPLEKVLGADDEALNWFKPTSSPRSPSPPPSYFPITPSAGGPLFLLKDKILGVWLVLLTGERL